MSYGFKIFNKDGILLIDDHERNYSVFAKGTTTTNTETIPIPENGGNWRIFVRPHDTINYIGGAVNYKKIFALVYGFNSTLNGFSNFTIDYIVLAPTSDITETNETFGLQTFNKNGKLIFSTRADILSIHSVFKEAYNSYNMNIVLPEVPGGKHRFIDANGFGGLARELFIIEDLGSYKYEGQEYYCGKFNADGSFTSDYVTIITTSGIPGGTNITIIDFSAQHDRTYIFSNFWPV